MRVRCAATWNKAEEFRQLILVGAEAPVAYFAYPGKNSVFTSPECEIYTLASPGEDYEGTLDALAAALEVHGKELRAEKAERPAMPSGEITLQGLAAAGGALLLENAIVVDESVTSGRGLKAATIIRELRRTIGWEIPRLDRNWLAPGGGRPGGLPGSPRIVPDCRWQCHVHSPSTVDYGTGRS
jgi:hypothetical protein